MSPKTTLTDEDRLALLDALEMMHEWLVSANHDWSKEDHEKFMAALRIIGPIE